MELIRKITIRTVGVSKADIKAKVKDAEGGVPLVRIVGETVEAKVGQTDKGQFIRLLGDFVAINESTGKRYQSAQCILPTFVSEPLAAALKMSQSVSFALLIGAKADDDSITGYVFTVESLTKAEPTDKMRRLLSVAGIEEAAAPEPEGKPAKGGKAKE